LLLTLIVGVLHTLIEVLSVLNLVSGPAHRTRDARLDALSDVGGTALCISYLSFGEFAQKDERMDRPYLTASEIRSVIRRIAHVLRTLVPVLTSILLAAVNVALCATNLHYRVRMRSFW
jgi:hypothetical protein